MTRSGMQLKFQSSIVEIRLFDRVEGRQKEYEISVFILIWLWNFIIFWRQESPSRTSKVHWSHPVVAWKISAICQLHHWQDTGSQKRRSEKKRARRRGDGHGNIDVRLLSPWFAVFISYSLEFMHGYPRKKRVWYQKLGDFPSQPCEVRN